MRRTYQSLITLVVLYCALFISSCTSPAKDTTVAGGVMDETETSIVSGKVVDSLQAPVPACSVWVRSLDASSPQKPRLAKFHITDTRGEFEFTGLPEGSYVLMATAPSLGVGLLQRFTLSDHDSVRHSSTMVLVPLQTLHVHLDTSFLGSNVEIPELGYSHAVTVLDFSIPAVPAGTYTIHTSLHTGDSLVVQSLAPSSVSLSSSSSEIATQIDWLQTSSSSSSILMQTPSSSSSSSSLGTSSSSWAAEVVVWDLTGRQGTVSDSRDGAVYNVTTIGTLVWFAENLRFAMAGTTCNPSDTFMGALCIAYGRYYTYAQATADACPSGWRLANLADWQNAFLFSNGESQAGKFLKSVYEWDTGTGQNTEFFNVRPAGSAASPTLGAEAYFWTSSYDKTGFAQAVHFSAGSEGVVTGPIDVNEGYSARCVQN